jgi:hypothetical protein
MPSLKRVGLLVIAAAVLSVLVGGWIVVQPVWQAPAVHATTGPTLETKLRQDVYALVTNFGTRGHERPMNLDRTADFIAAEFSLAGAKEVMRQTWRANGLQYQNVVATLGPDTQEVIVVGAHYDTFKALPGADDNASGVAGILALARELRGISLKKRVELVAYALEEPPYFRTPQMGSAVHARSLKDSGKQVRFMLSIECIGVFSDEPNSQDLPFSPMAVVYPTVGNFIALVGHYSEGKATQRIKRTMQAATSLPVFSINAPAIVAGIDFSDHLNYWNEGFVGMMVTDTAFMRNTNYHTEEDTPEKLDYARMAQVVQAVAAVVKIEANILD